jgi:hypothetical protein
LAEAFFAFFAGVFFALPVVDERRGFALSIVVGSTLGSGLVSLVVGFVFFGTA